MFYPLDCLSFALIACGSRELDGIVVDLGRSYILDQRQQYEMLANRCCYP